MTTKKEIGTIAGALHEVWSKCNYVQKTKENKFHGYKYAGEGDLLEVLRPAMVDAGLMPIPSILEVSDIDEYGNVRVKVEYTLIHKDGEVWPEKIIAYGMGNDKAKNGSVGDKGIYKAMTGANKYFLFKLFQIETGDDPEVDNALDTKTPPKQTPKRQAAKEDPRELRMFTTDEEALKWTGALRAKIDTCENVGEINTWISANTIGLDKLRDTLPDSHEAFVDFADNKRGMLFQAPADENNETAP